MLNGTLASTGCCCMGSPTSVRAWMTDVCKNLLLRFPCLLKRTVVQCSTIIIDRTHFISWLYTAARRRGVKPANKVGAVAVPRFSENPAVYS